MDAEHRPGVATFRIDLFAVLSRAFQFLKDGAPVVLFRLGGIDVRPLGAPQGHVMDSSYLRLNGIGTGVVSLVQNHSGLAYLCAGRDYIHDVGIRATGQTSIDPATRAARGSG